MIIGGYASADRLPLSFQYPPHYSFLHYSLSFPELFLLTAMGFSLVPTRWRGNAVWTRQRPVYSYSLTLREASKPFNSGIHEPQLLPACNASPICAAVFNPFSWIAFFTGSRPTLKQAQTILS